MKRGLEITAGMGNGYIGSADKLISTINQDILAGVLPANQAAYKFSFYNYQDCHVKINNGNTIFIPSGVGFEADIYDLSILHFTIVEAGIDYVYAGAFF